MLVLPAFLFAKRVATVLAAKRTASKMAGFGCTTPEMAADLRHAGFDWVVPANDAAMLSAVLLQWIGAARND